MRKVFVQAGSVSHLGCYLLVCMDFQMQLHLLSESIVLQWQVMLVCLIAVLGNKVLPQMMQIRVGKGVEQFFFIAKTNTDCTRAFPLLHQNGFQKKV